MKKKFLASGCFVALTIIALGLSGCVTTSPRCQVAVSNVKDEPVSDVVLTLGGVTRHTAPKLNPHSETYYEPTRVLSSREATVTWRNRDGETFSRRVTVEEKMGSKFRGKVYFQINKGDTVRAYVSPDKGSDEPLMPWGKPETWEGSVGFPGLPGQEDF